MTEKTVYFLVSLISVVAVANGFGNDGFQGYGYGYNQYNATNKSSSSRYLIMGHREYGDHCKTEHFVKDSVWFWGVVTHEPIYKVGRFERITQITARDKATNGKGARAKLTGGGPGFNNATIKFKSERGQGIDYEVEICARF
ncbi:probable salivary secreted peptide [Venturia canescens]|uniref:probable salivary secreted peptide n=1 Tax=Venturia canescens TaxID=32260 RepID=UPI001C9CEF0F|nr:probable salivary secreted peptide [Venturia canescens]